MNKRIILSVIALALLGTSVLHAQTDSLRYSVSGRVIDAVSEGELRGVEVSVPGPGFTTVTNDDGEFTIKSDAPIGELSFSHLGYKKENLTPEGNRITVRLSPLSLTLDPAVIVSANPEMLVREAVHKVRHNYVDQDELLMCFYRETMRKRQRYIYVSEAVARIFKTPYKFGVNRDAAGLDKSRVVLSNRKRDTLSVIFLGGPTLATNFDIVKNDGILLSDWELNHYTFGMKPPVSIGGRENFAVTFRPKNPEDVPYPLYSGTLYIDYETLAFTRIDMSMDVTDEEKASKDILVRKPAGLRFHPREVNIVMSYRQDGDKWRLGYARVTMRFACDWRKRLLQTNYSCVNELVVTGVAPEPVPIPREDQFKSRDALSEKAEYFTDPDFWKDYNIIEPTVSLEHAIDRLKKR
ncbi:MAG: carboxypeptidase-like regulatory domain-containing protein [Bacteroidales bacterium]|nr:carboxypeptidase-like regulatory domain-containing protein [Bacteroidales bacterium]